MNHFFAMHSRMKYINRWALMRNVRQENISEHSNDVAVIAHALAVIKNTRFDGNLNPDRAAFLGLYHDMTEIITGDMPTPVKYHSEDMRREFQKIEDNAASRLLNMLPEDMRAYYEDAFFPKNDDEYLWKIVKAADKLSALIKCIEELTAGNNEFKQAMQSTKQAIENMNMPEVNCFLDDFLPSFYLSLDEQNQ